MLAQALSRRFADWGIHYGWAIVGVTFLVSLVTAGAMGLPGALILPLSREFGWNTEHEALGWLYYVPRKKQAADS